MSVRMQGSKTIHSRDLMRTLCGIDVWIGDKDMGGSKVTCMNCQNTNKWRKKQLTRNRLELRQCARDIVSLLFKYRNLPELRAILSSVQDVTGGNKRLISERAFARLKSKFFFKLCPKCDLTFERCRPGICPAWREVTKKEGA